MDDIPKIQIVVLRRLNDQLVLVRHPEHGEQLLSLRKVRRSPGSVKRPAWSSVKVCRVCRQGVEPGTQAWGTVNTSLANRYERFHEDCLSDV